MPEEKIPKEKRRFVEQFEKHPIFGEHGEFLEKQIEKHPELKEALQGIINLQSHPSAQKYSKPLKRVAILARRILEDRSFNRSEKEEILAELAFHGKSLLWWDEAFRKAKNEEEKKDATYTYLLFRATDPWFVRADAGPHDIFSLYRIINDKQDVDDIAKSIAHTESMENSSDILPESIELTINKITGLKERTWNTVIPRLVRDPVSRVYLKKRIQISKLRLQRNPEIEKIAKEYPQVFKKAKEYFWKIWRLET
jgi:hypothetical protein